MSKFAVLMLVSQLCCFALAHAEERPAQPDAKPEAVRASNASWQPRSSNAAPTEGSGLLLFSGKPRQEVAKHADFSLIKGPMEPIFRRDH